MLEIAQGKDAGPQLRVESKQALLQVLLLCFQFGNGHARYWLGVLKASAPRCCFQASAEGWRASLMLGAVVAGLRNCGGRHAIVSFCVLSAARRSTSPLSISRPSGVMRKAKRPCRRICRTAAGVMPNRR